SASINIGQALNFEDDGPDASPKAEVTGSTVLDETGGLDTVTISASDIANLFNAPVYGADGAGSATYALSATDGAGTGLWLTGHSGAANEIKLVKVSDTVYEGREGGGSGALAFTVSINGSSGQVTVQQNATLEHTTDGNTPAAYDDSLSLGGAAAISVVQKVTDGDGDFDTATSANALSISFKDDGPDASPKAEVTGSTVLDETGGLDTVTISASDIANLFNAPVYGADGAGSATYALSATDGAGTGLWLTGHSGAANEIKLVKVSDTVYEGREGGGSGALAFTVSINGSSGQVTVQQNATLEHTTDGNTPAAYDDSLSLGGAAAISVVQKVTDGDGDFDTATSANALSISFKDDGPDASPKAEVTGSTVLDETGGLDTVTISASDIANLFNAPVYGADGAGSATYALSAT